MNSMLKLRNEQIEHLNAVATTRFHERLIQFIQDELSEFVAGMDNSSLHSYVRENQSRAAEHQIESEQGIASFVFLSVLLGSPIDEIPEFSRGLAAARDRDTYVELLLNALT